MSQENVGFVKWFNDKKGYGFITSEEESDTDEYFVHYSNIISDKSYKTLEPDQKVAFELESTSKGVQAVNVKVIG